MKLHSCNHSKLWFLVIEQNFLRLLVYSLAADFFVEKALSPEQAEARQFVPAGHNVFTWQTVACSQALAQRGRSKSERGTTRRVRSGCGSLEQARQAGVGKLGPVAFCKIVNPEPCRVCSGGITCSNVVMQSIHKFNTCKSVWTCSPRPYYTSTSWILPTRLAVATSSIGLSGTSLAGKSAVPRPQNK